MKERFNIEVAGIQFSIVSDDGAEFVEQTVASLNEGVQSVLEANNNYSKLDAVTLCALDYCGELHKAEAKIKNLEAQIEILEANMRRLREDAVPAMEETSEEKATEEKKEPETIEEAVAAEETEVADDATEDETPAAKTPADDADDSSRDQKFRQLEALLGSQLKFDLDK